MTEAANIDDVLEVQDVLNRYATAVDTKDWDRFRTVFTDDCTMVVGPTAHEGAAALAAHMEQLHAPLDASMHRLTNMEIEVTGDTATASTYMDAILIRDGHPAGPTFHILGVYEDVLRRAEGQWRIHERRYRRVWSEGDPAILAP